MAKVKICGLRRREDIDYVNEFMPDYVGFILAPSKRQITPAEVRKLSGQLNKGIKKVGVFVNQSVDMVAELLNEKVIDYAQLHGDEDNEYIQNLHSQVTLEKKNYGVIKAVRVRGEDDIKKADKYECDYLLLDAYSPEAAGGNGISFDWTLIKDMKKPFFLAGGISAENVCDAIEKVTPYAVDVSSSLENEGYKDYNKIKLFMEKARR